MANYWTKRRREQRANRRSQYSAIQPLPPIEAYQPCRDIRQGDEIYCAACGLRWAIDETRPGCPGPRR